MGNCMAFHTDPWKQTRSLLIEEAQTEFKSSSAPFQKINNGPCKRYILVRRKLQNEGCGTTEKRKRKTRKVKIVVTLEQLDLLLSGEKKKKKMMMGQSRNGVFWVKQSSWKPSLPTIPELHNS